MNIRKAAVIGAGAMGSGIAQVLSQAGIEVVLKDIEPAYVEKGLAQLKRMYESRVKKEVLTEAQAQECLARIKTTTGTDGFSEVDIVIEAALEQIEVKLKIFEELDRICPAHAVLASNTSALSISEIAAVTKHPERVVGMHFFNPAHVMKLVEVIPGVRTSNKVVEDVLQLCRDLGKEPVRVEECPGFLVNRLLFPYLNEAAHALQEGTHTPDEIDSAAVAFGFPMGPLALLDMTGVDVCFHVSNFLKSQFGSRAETAPLIIELMNSKQLGQKSGAGIYLYEKDRVPGKDEKRKINPELAKILEKIKPKAQGQAVARGGFDAMRVIMPMFNEATFALQEKVVAASDIDPALANGTGLKRGIMSLAPEKGLASCLEILKKYTILYGERFHPSWYLGKLVRANVHDFEELKGQ